MMCLRIHSTILYQLLQRIDSTIFQIDFELIPVGFGSSLSVYDRFQNCSFALALFIWAAAAPTEARSRLVLKNEYCKSSHFITHALIEDNSNFEI